jgi:hypothetical protein
MKYNSPYPPQYRLQDITNEDIALFSSTNDKLASPAIVDFIRQNLKVKPIDDYIVPVKEWNHLDFLFALEAGKYVNARIGTILTKYNI